MVEQCGIGSIKRAAKWSHNKLLIAPLVLCTDCIEITHQAAEESFQHVQ